MPYQPSAVKPLVEFVAGARGTGKTAYVVQKINRVKPKRLMVWDYKHDRSLEGIGANVHDLATLAKSANERAFKLRYLVDHGQDIDRQFHWFCTIAWEAGCLLMFVDELPEVSRPGRPPPVWKKCINVGRDYSTEDGARKWLSIMAAAQRPAECDKSIISNADIIHSGRLTFLEDAKQMAKTIGCKPQDLMTLPDLHWIEKQASGQGPERGILQFRNTKK